MKSNNLGKYFIDDLKELLRQCAITIISLILFIPYWIIKGLNWLYKRSWIWQTYETFRTWHMYVYKKQEVTSDVWILEAAKDSFISGQRKRHLWKKWFKKFLQKQITKKAFHDN